VTAEIERDALMALATMLDAMRESLRSNARPQTLRACLAAARRMIQFASGVEGRVGP
jgi:hypothetical protein